MIVMLILVYLTSTVDTKYTCNNLQTMSIAAALFYLLCFLLQNLIMDNMWK